MSIQPLLIIACLVFFMWPNDRTVQRARVRSHDKMARRIGSRFSRVDSAKVYYKDSVIENRPLLHARD